MYEVCAIGFSKPENQLCDSFWLKPFFFFWKTTCNLIQHSVRNLKEKLRSVTYFNWCLVVIIAYILPIQTRCVNLWHVVTTNGKQMLRGTKHQLTKRVDQNISVWRKQVDIGRILVTYLMFLKIFLVLRNTLAWVGKQYIYKPMNTLHFIRRKMRASKFPKTFKISLSS